MINAKLQIAPLLHHKQRRLYAEMSFYGDVMQSQIPVFAQKKRKYAMSNNCFSTQHTLYEIQGTGGRKMDTKGKQQNAEGRITRSPWPYNEMQRPL